MVDVFAEEKFSGNQLAVVLGAGGLSGESMQKIAREFNFSETTFVTGKLKRGGFGVRIFTPGQEIPFAGHPVLGTAYVIAEEVESRRVGQMALVLKAGRIPVAFAYRGKVADVLWMRQPEPVFGRSVGAASAARALGLGAKDIDTRFPVQEVSTGLPGLIVPLKSLKALKRAKVDADIYSRLVSGLDAKGILVFCPETRDNANDLSARFFAPYYGITEDPATGSANGCLAAYLLKHRYFGDGAIEARVEQGYEIKRPSLLHIKAAYKGEGIEVQVGGRVQMIARGEIIA